MRPWIAAWLVATCAVTACTTAPSPPDAGTIDATARRLMEREHVVGLGVALIDDGRVVAVRTYGRRDVERDLPLNADTVLYGASLVKAAFGYVVLQLVDEGRIDLDAPIATLLPKPLPDYERWKDLAGDERWRRLTPRLLLTHASGFANFRWLEPDRTLRFHFDPGTRYAYSGEGLLLLQFAIEEGLGLDVGREMQTRLFDRFGLTRTAMTWRADFEGDAASGHDEDGAAHPHVRRLRAGVAGSMDTTIADQARLWAAMVRGDGLSADARREWVRGQRPIGSPHQFPTLDTDTSDVPRRAGLAAGLGVLTFDGVDGRSWFKGGHDEVTGNMAICVERRRRCVIALSNDVRAERFYPELFDALLGPTAMPWAWEYPFVDGR